MPTKECKLYKQWIFDSVISFSLKQQPLALYFWRPAAAVTHRILFIDTQSYASAKQGAAACVLIDTVSGVN